MKTRNWSIRSKITALVAVPLSALLALWVFATVLTIGPALNLLSARALLDDVGKPGEALVAQLQRERRISVVYLSGRDDDSRFTAQRADTDAAVSAFLAAADSKRAQRVAGVVLRSRISEVSTALEGLTDGRDYIERRQVDSAGAHNLYTSLIDGVFRMFSATATYGDPQIDRETRALTTVGRAREWLSEADSLLAGAYTAGVFTGDDHGKLIQAIGAQQFLYAEAVADLPVGERTAYQRLAEGDAFVRLQQLQDILVRSSAPGAAPPVPASQWQPAYDSVVQQLRAFEINATEGLADRAAPVAVGIIVRLALAGLVGLIALVVSIVVAVRVGRSLISRLARLRIALDTAGEQLPQLVRRMRLGDEVDVEAESPSPDYGSDEIGRLGHAFSKVRRIAVQSAVDEAGVRRGINDVFLNIARRSQTLLHRQLSLLDKMERRATEPQELEDLYRVDHLATRMRRHAEDLVILAGAAPGRGWRNPVPVVDVVRGAISEVEDYKRIDVSGVETSSLVGRAVGDVIHLLAELLENATSFSPPNTRVQVAGQVVPNGYVIEIEDRGLGMAPEALDEANRRLLEPPEFDPADSARLGLFVVAKLAVRHRIRVQLRPSPYGGVTAVALIKAELITAGTSPAALPAGPTRAADPSAGPMTPAGPMASAGPMISAGPMTFGPMTSAGPTPPNGSMPSAGSMRAVGPIRPVGPDLPPAAVVPDRLWDRPAADVTAFDVSAVDMPLTDEQAAMADDEGQSTNDTPVSVNGLAQRRRRPIPRQRSAPADIVTPNPTWPPLSPGIMTPDPVSPDPVSPDPVSPDPVSPDPVVSDPVADDVALTDMADADVADTVVVVRRTQIPIGEDGLPRRVRQANLIPQLRQPVEPESQPTARSPEQARSLMSSLQRGTTQGRLAAATPVREAATPVREAATPMREAATPVREQAAAPPEEPPASADAQAGEPTAFGAGRPDHGGWADATTVGYPRTRDPAGAAAAAETIVHYGEIVPRRATHSDDPVSSRAAYPSRTSHDADMTQPEKDA